MDVFLEFLQEVLALVPVVAVAAPLISHVIDALKELGVIKDGYAGIISGLLNALAWVALFFAARAGVEEEVTGIIAGLGELAPYLIALILSVIGSKVFHMASKWTGTFGEKKVAY